MAFAEEVFSHGRNRFPMGFPALYSRMPLGENKMRARVNSRIILNLCLATIKSSNILHTKGAESSNYKKRTDLNSITYPASKPKPFVRKSTK